MLEPKLSARDSEPTNPQRAGFRFGAPPRVSVELTQIPGRCGTRVTCSGKDGGLQFFPLRDHVSIRENQPVNAWLCGVARVEP
jgi:hypothetical protein